MTKSKLFIDFNPVSAKAFKQKIQVDLKGADYNESLVWKSNEDIHVKPFYHREDTQEITPVPSMPEKWHIGEDIYILNAAVSAQTANKAIADGTEALCFISDAPFEIDELLNNLSDKNIPLYFQLNFLSEEFAKELLSKAPNAYLNIDIIGHLAQDGNWYHTLEKDHGILEKLLHKRQAHVLSVDTSLYQNAGATMVQQLAYGLAQANEYLNHTAQENLNVHSITFHVSIGANYFFEIAKLRALRILFELVRKEYDLQEGIACNIIARPTSRDKTIYDYNTNMLRTTTACMSAILGGANTVINTPYDALYHKTNDFGQRISRNQLIVLKKESYFDAVSNPADGTYYIEEITAQLAKKALTLFKDIEANGGFLKQLKTGIIQRKIKESATKEQAQFDKGEKILLGTNKYPNEQDLMKDQLELYPFLKTNSRKTLIVPIIPIRLAETIEKERLKKEV